MGSFFNMEGGFFNILGKAFDVIAISLIYIICCIPIITIGPATTALYYTTAKSIRKDRGYTTKEFFHSFRQNLKPGIIMGLIYTSLFLVMSFNIYAVRAMDNKMSSILFPIYLSISLFIAMTAIYSFPNLSRFTLSVKQIMKNSFFMSIRHIGSTFIMLILVVIAVLGVVLFPYAIIFMPGVTCLLISLMMERILKKYIPKDDSNVDAWYME